MFCCNFCVCDVQRRTIIFLILSSLTKCCWIPHQSSVIFELNNSSQIHTSCLGLDGFPSKWFKARILRTRHRISYSTLEVRPYCNTGQLVVTWPLSICIYSKDAKCVIVVCWWLYNISSADVKNSESSYFMVVPALHIPEIGPSLLLVIVRIQPCGGFLRGGPAVSETVPANTCGEFEGDVGVPTMRHSVPGHWRVLR